MYNVTRAMIANTVHSKGKGGLPDTFSLMEGKRHPGTNPGLLIAQPSFVVYLHTKIFDYSTHLAQRDCPWPEKEAD